jgi:hypothetical protein
MLAQNLITPDGWAGSSVNVLANQCNTLITHGEHQYAAFYSGDQRLVLAKRLLGEDRWETSKTQYTGRIADAHNAVAIAIDGDGYLHAAWDHHCSPLNYARGIAPGSLELGPPEPMTGSFDKRVTYPMFFLLPDGGLLFFYRRGVPSRGKVALNRYDPKARSWRQVHAALVDGEGQRSAYTAACVDQEGVLHLAWNWRDTPDVASNHDLCYARSGDCGETWSASDGKPLAVPITEASAEYAVRLPANSGLMNPPALTVDGGGRPCIASYWSPAGTRIPQFHLVRHDGRAWSVTRVTQRTNAFALNGFATRRPPISRAAIVARRTSSGSEFHLVYRESERGQRVVAVSCTDLESPQWTTRELTAEPVGAWEPSVDIEQWRRHGHVHLLLQVAEQIDGDDRNSAEVAPTPVSVLVWEPGR